MSAKPVVREAVEHPDDAGMRRLVVSAQAGELDDEDVAALARGLAASGARLAPDRGAADLASTGGPSSLSTLICPLHLRARGLKVPKLGVPGRPAGGIDVLQTIPGYQAALEPRAAASALKRSGYIHLLADERWAPFDARLFAYRQREGAQRVPSLVIASILAKKLAAGTMGAGLEIRIAPHGNFGVDLADGRRNAQRYNAVAKLLGLQPVCVLTDGTRPYQPYIGRGEALVALAEVLSGKAAGWLASHEAHCQRLSDAVASVMGIETTQCHEATALRRVHDELLATHGTRPEAFEARVEAIRAAPRTTVHADRSGMIDYDLGRLRQLLVARQRANASRPGDPPADPAGVILEARVETRVESTQPVMSIRVPESECRLAESLASCVRIRLAGEMATPAWSSLEIV